MSFSIIIPSRNLDNLKACVAAIRAAGETARIIVVWDDAMAEIGIVWFVWVMNEIYRNTPGDGSYRIMPGAIPFCFARNVNIGIRAAGDDDVILLNDDALLESSNGAQGLSMMATTNANCGLLSARVRGVAHPAHLLGAKIVRGAAPRGPVMVPFVCVFIPRRVIEQVGLLDERFFPGGYEDDDYCRRVRLAGFDIGVYDGCVVDHQTLPHTFRPKGKPHCYDLATNRQRYLDKWR